MASAQALNSDLIETRSSDDAYLAGLAERVRTARARRGMTRKILARDSGVSERYLAQLETGQGNISLLLLRQVARALDVSLASFAFEGPEPSPSLDQAIQFLKRLAPSELDEARRLLAHRFGAAERAKRVDRIALVGLRGAGKSTLGVLLAKRLRRPFIELDKEIEAMAGLPLGAIFDLYGQPGFRRLERRCLERIMRQSPRAVIATGGGLVAEPETFERLLSSYYTIWIRASPAEHMGRVLAQGDMRPMANNREAMADLRRILRAREALYGKADAQVDTTRRSIQLSLDRLAEVVAAANAR